MIGTIVFILSMKPSYFLLLLLTLFCSISCGTNDHSIAGEKAISSKEIPIYGVAVGEKFTLTIDSAVVYQKDSGLFSLPTMVHKIGSVERQKGKLSTVFLKVNDHDTLFQIPLYKFDSVMFGYGMGKGFLIETNFDANEWGKD